MLAPDIIALLAHNLDTIQLTHELRLFSYRHPTGPQVEQNVTPQLVVPTHFKEEMLVKETENSNNINNNQSENQGQITG